MLTEIQTKRLLKEGVNYFAKELMHEIDENDYWTILRALWIENGKCNDLYEYLFFYSGKKRKHKVMKSADRQALRKLPKKIKIYRGCKEKTDENKFNWSTDRAFVEKYIGVMEGYYIAEKEIDKEKVFAYFNSRGESEIILKKE